MPLLIHAGIKVIFFCKKGPLIDIERIFLKQVYSLEYINIYQQSNF